MSDFFSAILESGVNVPKLPRVDLTKEQQAAITANQAALPGSEAIASSVNTFNYQQLQKMLSDSIPNFNAINKTATGNILSELKGQIPQDVQDQILRSDAFKSLRGGFAGGGMSDALTARDLGLTSLDLTNKGLDSASRWITMARNTMIPGQFDVSSMFISPLQLYQTENEQNLQQFQRKYASNVMDAHYSWSSRIGRGLDAALDIVLSMYGKPQQPNPNQGQPTPSTPQSSPGGYNFGPASGTESPMGFM